VVNDEFDEPPSVHINVELLRPAEEPDVLCPAGLAAFGVRAVWLLDRGADIDSGTNELDLSKLVLPVSESAGCVPGVGALEGSLDARPATAVDPVTDDTIAAADVAIVAIDDPLTTALGVEDGAVRLVVAVESTLA
jgi:hypothetical protein